MKPATKTQLSDKRGISQRSNREKKDNGKRDATTTMLRWGLVFSGVFVDLCLEPWLYKEHTI